MVSKFSRRRLRRVVAEPLADHSRPLEALMVPTASIAVPGVAVPMPRRLLVLSQKSCWPGVVPESAKAPPALLNWM